MKKRVLNKKTLRLLIVAVSLALLCAACLIAVGVLSRTLLTQQEAERWRGDSELEFAQISCFLAADEEMDVNAVGTFRGAVATKLHEAALDIDTDDTLFVDAWSTTGKLHAETALGNGDVSVIAVGGEFFQFHPLRLLSGRYITERDLMKDMVLLDVDAAWLLFGGTDLQGLELKLGGENFVVAGVVEREDDAASSRAYTAGTGIFMSYDGYKALVDGESNAQADTADAAASTSTVGISCYEVVLPEPVDGFALGVVKDKFPIGQGEIVSNSDRFELARLVKLAGKFGYRSMQTHGVIYPYWENAARFLEDWCALLTLLALVSAVMPLGLLLFTAIRLLWRGKRRLEEKTLPKLKDSAEEAVRVRQRRRWEKKHGTHEK